METSVYWLFKETVRFEVEVGYTRKLQKCNSGIDVLSLQASNIAAPNIDLVSRWHLMYKPKLMSKNFGLYINRWHSKTNIRFLCSTKNTQKRLACREKVKFNVQKGQKDEWMMVTVTKVILYDNNIW